MQLVSAVAIAAIAFALPAKAAELDRVAALVCQDESGCENVPNYKWQDGHHSAGGIWQISKPLWDEFAPLAGIDVATHPNAMTVSRDKQGEVFGYIWHYRGAQPWTCCNKRLARDLARGGAKEESSPSQKSLEHKESHEPVGVGNPFVGPGPTPAVMSFNLTEGNERHND